MKVDVLSINELESNIHHYLASRTKVYNTEPIGLGTAYVESLSSYIVRLASQHSLSVTTFLKKIVSPFLERDHIKKELESGISKGLSNFINENSIVTLECVHALEILTGRKDIINLTMLNWTGVFHQDLRSATKKWCPQCFDKMEKDSLEIYEPLLWSLKDIEKCDIHNLKLEDKCQCCCKTIPYFHSNLQLGFCPYCQSWLGENNNVSVCELTKEEQFIYLNYKQLIQENLKLSYFPTSKFFSMYLNTVKEKLNIKSKMEFARMLSIPSVSLSRWMNNSFQPNRRNVLKLMYKINTTLYDAVYNMDSIELEITEEETNNSNEKVDKRILELKLLEALEDIEPKSLTLIAKQNGYYASYAQRHFPELSEKIQKKYLEFMEQKKHLKKAEIEKVLNAALVRESPISLKQLLEENDISERSARLYAPELCGKVSARNKVYLSESKEKRINNILDNVRRAASELHQKGVFPSKDRINKKMGKLVFKETAILKHWQGIVEELGYDLSKYKKNQS